MHASEKFLEPLNRFLARMSFTSGVRLDFYRSLILLLDNQVRLNEALAELHNVYSHGGKKLNAPVAMVINECLQRMNDGESFSETMAWWLPVEEAMLLQAGELAGRLGDAFNEAEKIMAARKKIVGAIAGAVAYPLVLFAMMGFLLQMVANDLVPKLAKVVDPAKWEGAAGLLRDIASFVTNYGSTTVIVIVVTFTAITISLPRLRGPLRVALDNLPPWSIYRLVHGATFLLNVGALIKSGMRLNSALEKLSEGTSPWLEERITAALDGLSEGKNFGEALTDSGYNFPDKKANRFLAVISTYSGIDKAIISFGNRWLEETVNKIQSISKFMLMSGVACVGITMLLVIAGAGGIQDAIQASVG
ncbi:MAG TPA: type II secretion system F family protein [Buttiauxella sp.]|jgi:type II secretory pathway component PulF